MTIKEFMEKDKKKKMKKLLISGGVLSPIILPIANVLDNSMVLTNTGHLIIQQSGIELCLVFLQLSVLLTVSGIIIGILSIDTYNLLKGENVKC